MCSELGHPGFRTQCVKSPEKFLRKKIFYLNSTTSRGAERIFSGATVAAMLTAMLQTGQCMFHVSPF